MGSKVESRDQDGDGYSTHDVVDDGRATCHRLCWKPCEQTGRASACRSSEWQLNRRAGGGASETEYPISSFEYRVSHVGGRAVRVRLLIDLRLRRLRRLHDAVSRHRVRRDHRRELRVDVRVSFLSINTFHLPSLGKDLCVPSSLGEGPPPQSGKEKRREQRRTSIPPCPPSPPCSIVRVGSRSEMPTPTPAPLLCRRRRFPRSEPRALSVARIEFTYTACAALRQRSVRKIGSVEALERRGKRKRGAEGQGQGRTFAERKVEREVDKLRRLHGVLREHKGRVSTPIYTSGQSVETQRLTEMSAPIAHRLPAQRKVNISPLRASSHRAGDGRRDAPRQQPRVHAVRHQHADRRVRAVSVVRAESRRPRHIAHSTKHTQHTKHKRSKKQRQHRGTHRTRDGRTSGYPSRTRAGGCTARSRR